MRVSKVGAAVLATGVLAMVLSGCVVFKAAKVEQVGKKPKVIVSFKICGSDDDGDTCPGLGNSGWEPDSSEWRLLVGFRVPKGTVLPSSIEPKAINFNGGTGTSATVMDRNRSYTRQLNSKAPRNAQQSKYVGYSSEPLDVPNEAGYNSSARFSVKMGLKPRLYEKLIGRRFKVRPVVGSYQVSDVQPENDPISCGPDPFESGGPNEYFEGEWKICIDSPLKNEFKNLRVKIKAPAI